jgi:hypothetical protein
MQTIQVFLRRLTRRQPAQRSRRRARCQCTCRPATPRATTRYPVVVFPARLLGNGRAVAQHVGLHAQCARAAGLADREWEGATVSSASSSTGGRRSVAASGSTREGIGRYRDYVARDLDSLRRPHLPHLAPKAPHARWWASRRVATARWSSRRFHPEHLRSRRRALGRRGFEYCYLNALPQAAGPDTEGWRRRGLVPRVHRASPRDEDEGRRPHGHQHAVHGGGVLAQEG